MFLYLLIISLCWYIFKQFFKKFDKRKTTCRQDIFLDIKKNKQLWKPALLIIGIGFVLFLFIWFLFDIHTEAKVRIEMAPLFLIFFKKKLLWWIAGLFFGVYLSVLRFVYIASSYGFHFPMGWLEDLEALQQKPLLMDGGNALGFPRESSQNLGGASTSANPPMEPEVSVPVQAEPERIPSEKQKLLAMKMEAFNKIKTPQELHEFLCDENVGEQYKQLAVKKFFSPMTRGELVRGLLMPLTGDRSLPLPENVSTVQEKKQYLDIANYNGLQYARRFMDPEASERFSKEYYGESLLSAPGQSNVPINMQLAEISNSIKKDLSGFHDQNPKFQRIVVDIQRDFQKKQGGNMELSHDAIYQAMTAWAERHHTHPRLLIEPALDSNCNITEIVDWSIYLQEHVAYRVFLQRVIMFPEGVCRRHMNLLLQGMLERDFTRDPEQLQQDVELGLIFWLNEVPITSHKDLVDPIRFPQVRERIIELALENLDGDLPNDWRKRRSA